MKPQAEKFYQALVNVAGGGELLKSKKLHGRHAVHNDDWWAECVQLGLIDPKEKQNSARALFSKNRRELVLRLYSTVLIAIRRGGRINLLVAGVKAKRPRP